MAFAENTTVPVDKTRGEIERLITIKHKCKSYQSGIDFVNRTGIVQFQAHDRFVRFTIALPDPNDTKRFGWGQRARKLAEQAERTIWRALLLVVKAKLEAVESKIATFEEEFLAHIVMPNDQTVGTLMLPIVARAYQTGAMPFDRLLTAGEDPK